MAQAGVNGSMMFERVRVVIGDSDADIAAGIKDSLHERGIVEVLECSTTEKLYRALDEEIVDLLLYDYHLLNAQFVAVMQRIRRKEVGLNPFVTIIATIRDSKAEIVERLIDAGVDDLIRMPISIDRVFESIGNSTRRRKPFVVASDYVGPTRPSRRHGRSAAPGAANPVQVPNTLKSRAIDDVPEEELQRIVASAVEKMVAKQLEACGLEIDALAQRVTETYSAAGQNQGGFAMRGALNRMAAVADDLQKRAEGTSSEGVSDLASALIPITQRILEAPGGRAAVEVQILSQLATAVRRALTVEPDAQPAMQEIASTVSGFARRRPGVGAQASLS